MHTLSFGHVHIISNWVHNFLFVKGPKVTFCLPKFCSTFIYLFLIGLWHPCNHFQVSSFTPHKHGCSNFDFFKVGINIKSILIGMYNYFVHNDKWYIELCKLVELFKAKRNKIFKKLKKLKHLCYYQWRALIEYNIWVVKMVANNATIDNIKSNYEFLCDLKTLN